MIPRIHTAWLTVAVLLGLVLLLAGNPAAALEAALRGVAIWWDVLFPALFPFFVLSELMLGFGLVHFFGTLLDPLMRPLFRVPGIGGFVLTMGFASGYPVGARLTAQLWDKQLISRTEGERLVGFTTTSDPIFLIGAVAVGFFHNPALAPLLALSHYGGALLVGFIMRLHGERADKSGQKVRPHKHQHRNRLLRALYAMDEARLADGRPLGQLLQEAVQSALKLMMIVGGLVVVFSVIMELLTRGGWTGLMLVLLQGLFIVLQLPPGGAEAFIFGFFEVTLGARQAGTSPGLLLHQCAAASWVLAWGGLSVHAQVASLLSRTQIRYGPFLVARFLHGLLSLLLVYVLWTWFAP